MKFFDSKNPIKSFLDAPFFFNLDKSSTKLKSAGSASPIKNASKKSLNGAGFVTPQPPAITIGSSSVLSLARR